MKENESGGKDDGILRIGYIADNELRGCDSLDVRRIAANVLAVPLFSLIIIFDFL